MGYSTVHLIPKGSFDILIEQGTQYQREPDTNYLALKDEADNYILNGNRAISIQRREVHFGGVQFDYSGSSALTESIKTSRYDKLTNNVYLEVLMSGTDLIPPNIQYRYRIDRHIAPK